jgi:hypothetical protein
MNSFLLGIGFALPGLILPAIVGIYLWRSSTPGTYRRMLALFALKPWLTTPLFILIVLRTLFDPSIWGWIVPMVPGLIVTLLLVGMFGAIMRARPGSALLILGGDAARWVLATVALHSLPWYGSGLWEALMPALIWTSVYALLCWGLAWYDERRTAAPAAL